MKSWRFSVKISKPQIKFKKIKILKPNMIWVHGTFCFCCNCFGRNFQVDLRCNGWRGCALLKTGTRQNNYTTLQLTHSQTLTILWDRSRIVRLLWLALSQTSQILWQQWMTKSCTSDPWSRWRLSLYPLSITKWYSTSSNPILKYHKYRVTPGYLLMINCVSHLVRCLLKERAKLFQRLLTMQSRRLMIELNFSELIN